MTAASEQRGSVATPRRRGVGLVELLIALMITSGLLTATALAIDAAYTGYKVNQEHSSLLNRSRMVMHRLTSMMRVSDAHEPYSAGAVASFVAGGKPTDSGFKMLDAQGRVNEVYHDTAAQTLLWTVDGQTRVLLEGVSAFSVQFEPGQTIDGKRQGVWDELYRATLTLSVRTTSTQAGATERTGRQTVSLSCSVMPRGNSWR